nr:MAG TPA: hypothetical protein [Caudoviricetes sp.]
METKKEQTPRRYYGKRVTVSTQVNIILKVCSIFCFFRTI